MSATWETDNIVYCTEKESKMNNVEVSDSSILVNGKVATYTQLEAAYRGVLEEVSKLKEENSKLKEKMILNGIGVDFNSNDIKFLWKKFVEIKDLVEYLQNR